jgi:predicted RND superfamily exporter protein
VDEALVAAHNAAYTGGAEAGYSSAYGAYGLGITKLWGDTNLAYGYWLNDVSCFSLEDEVKEGDDLVAFVYKDGIYWSDVYATFDQSKYTAPEGKATVKIEKSGYDANWNTVFSALEGASLKVYDKDFKEVKEGFKVTELGQGQYEVLLAQPGEYYLVGSTAMSYEISHSFKQEYLIISIVTAIAVFLVVWFTFKKFFLSVLLIAVIEGAVFSMMSVMVAINLPMFFVALILVQCILMGSMIDYGILFTTYYMEVRKEFSVEKALPEVMKRSTHAILTSSLIIVLVTLICGRLMSGAVASILTTLGIGALCAILLILFVLPSLLVIFDKQVVKQENQADDDF